MFNSHRDDRRRRALVEESAGEAAPAGALAASSAATMAHLRRLTMLGRRVTSSSAIAIPV